MGDSHLSEMKYLTHSFAPTDLIGEIDNSLAPSGLHPAITRALDALLSG